MENPKFEIYKSPVNNQFFFRLRARNGEIILSSEGYTTKDSCMDGIASVKHNSQFENRFDRRRADSGEYYFILKAVNGEIIGVSEMYTTNQGREEGYNAVVKYAFNAPVSDELVYS